VCTANKIKMKQGTCLNYAQWHITGVHVLKNIPHKNIHITRWYSAALTDITERHGMFLVNRAFEEKWH
jgi:hypothetical protein